MRVQAYSLRMFGAKYQWILAGRFADDWWRETQQSATDAADADAESEEEESEDNGDERRCGEETLRLALNGYICADILILSSSRQSTIANMVSMDTALCQISAKPWPTSLRCQLNVPV